MDWLVVKAFFPDVQAIGTQFRPRQHLLNRLQEIKLARAHFFLDCGSAVLIRFKVLISLSVHIIRLRISGEVKILLSEGMSPAPLTNSSKKALKMTYQL